MKETEERKTFTVDGRRIKLSSVELLQCVVQWVREVYGDTQQTQFREAMLKWAVSEGEADLEERAREAEIYAEIAEEEEREREEDLSIWAEVLGDEG